jgi:seryl-tRNA(Sec) selenium transferase
MISEKENSLKKRAEAWSEKIGFGMVISGKSTIGGGSLPEETLPTWLFSLQVKHPDAFLKKLRYSTLPILARIQNDLIVFDPRTVLEEQDEVLVSSIIKILQETREKTMKNELEQLMKSNGIAAILITGAADHNPAMTYFTGHVHVSHGDLVIKPGEKPISSMIQWKGKKLPKSDAY